MVTKFGRASRPTGERLMLQGIGEAMPGMRHETGKHCGGCTLCCKVMEIEQLAKPANSWCPHCLSRDGCAIYRDRPAECASFSCLWLSNEQLDDRWKPSKAKFVLTTSDDGIEIRCDPGFPDAWRRAAYQPQIREWARRGEENDVTVIIVIGRRVILVTPERDFDLGEIKPDQRIVRELEGTRVVDARLVTIDADSGA